MSERSWEMVNIQMEDDEQPVCPECRENHLVRCVDCEEYSRNEDSAVSEGWVNIEDKGVAEEYPEGWRCAGCVDVFGEAYPAECEECLKRLSFAAVEEDEGKKGEEVTWGWGDEGSYLCKECGMWDSEKNKVVQRPVQA